MVLGLLRWIAWGLILLILLVLGARTYVALTDDRLAVWHRYAPGEPTADEIDAMDWAGWMAAEDRVFAEVRENVTLRLSPDEMVPLNRYWEGSPLYTPGFATDWNRSFVLMPQGEVKGAVALLHGLTDSPYSLRHVAELYRAKGYVAVGIRMPGHGTVPGGLEAAEWPQWMAATRLAMREARRLAGPDKPLDLVGYSNGGALAMIYEADALEIPALPAPDRIVLVSPMIGVTFFARFAGIAGWPALLPAFDRAAWFDLIPEYNPFKYNSFPVNGGRQSFLLTEEVRERLDAVTRSGAIARAAPVLTFQSVVDSTVSAQAVTDLYDRLPANGSELVLYDVNRGARMAPMLRPAALAGAARLAPAVARPYRTVVIGAEPGRTAAVERVREPGSAEEATTPLGADYPRDIFSLSHVALPFPPWDGLYGYAPDGREDFGISLGSLSARGETGTLTMSLDQVGRLMSNPFFDGMMARIGRMIDEQG